MDPRSELKIGFAPGLREEIVRDPQRAAILATFAGFVIGGGLNHRTSAQLILLVAEEMIGGRIGPLLLAGFEKHANGRSTNH